MGNNLRYKNRIAGGSFIQFFRPKIKNKRKRPRNHRKIASRLLSSGIKATPKRVIEWSKEGKRRPTPSEKRFSEILTEINVRHSFRCQQVLFGYIIDFYAPRYMLAVEIDGGYHNSPDQKIYDTIRTQKLNNKGISVLRFTNEEVLNDPLRVMSHTQDKLRSCYKVNKIKKRWKIRNRRAETRDINIVMPFHDRFAKDNNFPSDAFEVVDWYSKSGNKMTPMVILRRGGVTVHEVVKASA